MEKDFDIVGVSYVGNPRSHTAMFVTKKAAGLLENLRNTSHCLVFTEAGIEVDMSLQAIHRFIFTEYPQLEYARFANRIYQVHCAQEKKKKYVLQSAGYYMGENVIIGDNAYIEPQCVIGHGVVIGRNAVVLAGTVIKNSVIGDDFLANEHAVIGAFGFTMTEDEDHNRFRIPTLGRVMVGNQVEIGAHDNISCGTGGNTILDDYVKLDALVHIGHDVHLERNVEITAGSIIGGFTVIKEGTYVGINSSVRNRITIGENTVIGMGSNVTKNMESDITAVGNPARILRKNSEK